MSQTGMAMVSVLLLGRLVSGKFFPMLLIKGLAYVTLFAACLFLCGGCQQKR